MRTDLLTRFKKSINNIKDIERYLERMADRSFVKYSMLKDTIKEIKDLKRRALESHEECEGNPGLYVIEGISFEIEVRNFYQSKIKYYRWLLDL